MNVRNLPRLRGLALAATATAAVAVAAPAAAAPSVQLTLGVTQVALSSEFVGALGALGVTPDNVLPGALYTSSRGARVAFPIPTGELDGDGPKLEILHSGGLTLTAGNTRVALTSFIIENLGENLGENGPLQLTGVVKANDSILGRVPLFNIALTQAPSLSDPAKRGLFGIRSAQLTIKGANVTLTDEAAGALNSVFGVTAFTKDFPIGVAEVSARVSDLDR
jgi:hypothetical protein